MKYSVSKYSEKSKGNSSWIKYIRESCYQYFLYNSVSNKTLLESKNQVFFTVVSYVCHPNLFSNAVSPKSFIIKIWGDSAQR